MEDMTKEPLESCVVSNSLRMAGFSSPFFGSLRNDRGGGASGVESTCDEICETGGVFTGVCVSESCPLSEGGSTNVSSSSESSVNLLNLGIRQDSEPQDHLHNYSHTQT